MNVTQKQLPPGPRSWVPWRVFKELRRDPLAFLTKLTQVYGDVSSFWAMGQRYVVLNHPDLVREVLLTQAEAFWKGPALQNSKGIFGEGLLTAEGKMHRGQRRLMQPSFHAKHVESYAPVMMESTAGVVEKWRQEIAGGQVAGGAMERDIRPVMMGLTLVIAGRTLFGTLLADEIERVHQCMDDLMRGYVRAVVPWGRLLNHLPLTSTKRLAQARADLYGLVDAMIAARRREMELGAFRTDGGNSHMLSGGAGAQGKSGCPFAAGHGTPMATTTRTDLLSMMIAATDSEGGNGRTRLTDVQLRDQSITILTAGHETTANALTFTLYLLAKHPKEQRLLREEVHAVVGGGEPTVEMMDRLPRTRWVLSESMRLLPPAWTLGRQNQREVELGNYRIPAKTTVLIPQWTLHQDPRFWEKPEAFLPERWRNPTHPRFAYIPFSTGPRNCIGESFAWLEMMLALPMLIKHLTFSLPDNFPPLRLMPAITLRPRDPVTLLIRPIC